MVILLCNFYKVKIVFLIGVFFVLEACVYAPNQAWKPHRAILTKKKI